MIHRQVKKSALWNSNTGGSASKLRNLTPETTEVFYRQSQHFHSDYYAGLCPTVVSTMPKSERSLERRIGVDAGAGGRWNSIATATTPRCGTPAEWRGVGQQQHPPWRAPHEGGPKHFLGRSCGLQSERDGSLQGMAVSWMWVGCGEGMAWRGSVRICLSSRYDRLSEHDNMSYAF